MTVIEGTLIIIGFLCVCISFFIARKSNSGEEQKISEGQSADLWTEKEEKIILDRVQVMMQDRQNEIVDDTEEKMNRLCNEKIMAIDEFSQQLLEKIENNHQEVVFMYNMLNEKEKDMKKVVEPKPLKPKAVESKPLKPKVVESKPLEPKSLEVKPLVRNPKAQPVKNGLNVPGNVNLQIRKMHKAGKSILDISKELGIGQGEVKLVIALYGGKK